MNDQTRVNINTTILGYINCALWADSPDDETADMFTIDNVSPEFLQEASANCKRFFDSVIRLGVKVEDYTLLGHDLWLTRNGHGAGFWDGDWEDGDMLTELVDSMFSETYIYLGDNNKIYFG